MMFILLFVLLLLPVSDDIAINQPAPQFKIKTIDGKNFKLADMQGTVVVLNFWSIGCAPCRKEIPALNKVVSEFKNEKIAFIAPAFDGPRSLKAFLKDNVFDYHVVADPDAKISDLFNANSFPTHIVINKQGIIHSIIIGDYEASVEELRGVIKKLL